jgi:hypothetical protein
MKTKRNDAIMKTKTQLCLTIALLGLGLPAHADILELKNGTVLNGKYVGGTAGTVRYETSAGMQVFATSDIVALTFTTPAATPAMTPAAAPPVATPAPAPAPAAAAPSSVTLPYGTTLLVRMMDSVSSRNGTGAKFTTKLEYNLMANGVVAAPAGTIIYGRVQSATQAGRALGRSTLDLRLAQMVVNGSPIPISTSSYAEAGAASIRKAAGGAAAGAAIGAIAGDAGKGAAIGATASLLKKGETITIPPGTLLEFTLTQPVTFGAGN